MKIHSNTLAIKSRLSLITGEANETDYFKRISPPKCMEYRSKKFTASYGKRFMYLTSCTKIRKEMCKISTGQLSYF